METAPERPATPGRRARSVAAKQVSESKTVSSVFACNPGTLAPWGVTVAAIVVLALVVFGVVAVPGQGERSWQAVFLANGQVYFGHVASQSPSTLVLRDVYYLQSTSTLQQGADGQSVSVPDLTLVKLGDELHAPTNEMRINREHVLFTEVLRSEGAVAQAILALERGDGAPTQEFVPPPPNAPATPSATIPPQSN